MATGITYENTWDSGWKFYEPDENSYFILNNPDEPIGIRRIGNMVNIQGVVQPKEQVPAGTDFYRVLFLPLEFNPSHICDMECHGDEDTVFIASIKRTSSADIHVFTLGCYRAPNTNTYSGMALGSRLPFNLIYLSE